MTNKPEIKTDKIENLVRKLINENPTIVSKEEVEEINATIAENFIKQENQRKPKMG